MVGKKSGKALLREEGTNNHSQYLQDLSFMLKTTFIGLERTDNNMNLTSWPNITGINQKNYYTWVVSSDS